LLGASRCAEQARPFPEKLGNLCFLILNPKEVGRRVLKPAGFRAGFSAGFAKRNF
jgi:hypothetical protein